MKKIFVFILVSIIALSLLACSPAPQSNKPTGTPSQTDLSSAQDKTDNSSAEKETVSQKNAVSKAKSYLMVMAFSRDGLVAQLEFDKFSTEDAAYGVDNAGADWNEQAAKKAQSYLDVMAFSRDGLIDQLVFDKFTREQAEYGVTKVGL